LGKRIDGAFGPRLHWEPNFMADTEDKPATAPSLPAADASPDDIAKYAEDIFSAEEAAADEAGQSDAGAADTGSPEPGEEGQEPEPTAEQQEKKPADKAADEASYEVVVDGQPSKVTLGELRAGYQRQQDYSRKTAEVASERRAAMAERQQLAAHARAYADALATVDPVIAEGDKTDWAKLAETDPVTWAAKRELYNQRKMQQRRAIEDAEVAEEAAQAEVVATEHQELVKKLQDWAVPEKRKAMASEIDGFLAEQGYDPAERKALKDHRAILIIRDAIAYRKWTKAQSEGQKKRAAAPPPRTARPQAQADRAGPSANAAALKKRAIASGDPSDIADAAMAILRS